MWARVDAQAVSAHGLRVPAPISSPVVYSGLLSYVMKVVSTTAGQRFSDSSAKLPRAAREPAFEVRRAPIGRPGPHCFQPTVND